MRRAPPLLNPTKGGFESSNECASYRDRHAGLQSTEARRPTSAGTIAKQMPGCPNATEAPRSAALLSQGWCQAMTKAMRGARHAIRRSHTELRECCQAAAGRNWAAVEGRRGQGRRFQQDARGVGDTYGRWDAVQEKGVFVVSLREERKRKGKIRESCR